MRKFLILCILLTTINIAYGEQEPCQRLTQIEALIKQMEGKYRGRNPLISSFLISAQRYAKGFPEGASGMDRIFLNSLRFSGTPEEEIKEIVDNFNALPQGIKERFINQRDTKKGYQRDELFDEYISFTRNVSIGTVRVYPDKIDGKTSGHIDICKEGSDAKSPRIFRMLPPHGIEPLTWLVEPLSEVRLIGENFREGLRVFIHPVKMKHLSAYSPKVNVINDSEIEFQVPDGITHLPDMYRVVVVNTDGSCSQEDDDLLEILPYRYSISISKLKKRRDNNDSNYYITYFVSDGTSVYARNAEIQCEHLKTGDECLLKDRAIVSQFRPKNGILYLKLTGLEKKSDGITGNSLINMVLSFTSPVVTCMSQEWEEIEKKPLCAVSGVEAVSDLITLLNILSDSHYIGSFSEFYNVASLEGVANTQKKVVLSNMEIYLNFEKHPVSIRSR